jgi:hypothetical protein
MKTLTFAAAGQLVAFSATNHDTMRAGFVDTPDARTVLEPNDVAFIEHETAAALVHVVVSDGIVVEPMHGTVKL